MNRFVTVKDMRFGLTSQTIGLKECPYLTRTILWIGPWSLRYHVFWRSDEERALHDHPWAFLTFPLNTYREEYMPPFADQSLFRDVKRFRFHYRHWGFIHRVIVPSNKPARTFVWTFRKRSSWGFWVGKQYLPWRNWFGIYGQPPCKDVE